MSRFIVIRKIAPHGSFWHTLPAYVTGGWHSGLAQITVIGTALRVNFLSDGRCSENLDCHAGAQCRRHSSHRAGECPVPNLPGLGAWWRWMTARMIRPQRFSHRLLEA